IVRGPATSIMDIYPTCVVPPALFFNDTPTTEIYTLSLHDALPIWPKPLQLKLLTTYIPKTSAFTLAFSTSQRLRTTRASVKALRSEERFSRNAETDLVCRLLLEKKK